MEEEKKESLDQELETASTESATDTVKTPESPEVVKEETKPETVSLLGREYDLSKIDQVRELAKDYDRLGRNYTFTAQQLAQLEKMSQEKPMVSSSPDLADPETVEYLRKLGFVHKEEQIQEREDNLLENNLQRLAETYDGKDGKPRFDRERVLEFCIQNGVSNPEYGYKLMNYDALKEFELRQAKSAPIAPPSSGGEGGPRLPQPKKRAIGVPKEDEISLRDAIFETLEHETPTTTA